MEQMESSSTAAPATSVTTTTVTTTTPGNETECADEASQYQCNRVIEKNYCIIPDFRNQCKLSCAVSCSEWWRFAVLCDTV